MKRFVLGAAVPALIVLAIVYHSLSKPRDVPAIAVAIADESSGGTQYVPAVNGYVSGHGSSVASDGTREIYRSDETCEVVSTAPGQFVIYAHYLITRDGVLTPVTRTLPVWGKEPDNSKWVRVDDHLLACAYLSGTTLRY